MAIDTNAFIESERKSKELSRIVGGWTGAWAGAKIGSAGGAVIGTKVAVGLGFAGPQALAPEEVATVPVGAGAGAVIGGGIGGMVGYGAGSQAGVNYYNFINGEF